MLGLYSGQGEIESEIGETWVCLADVYTTQLMTSLRSQLDVYERISSKGLSDATLEPILSSIPDPFSAYGPPRNDEQIFSILGPNNLTSVTTSPNLNNVSPADGTTANDVISQLIMSPSTPAKGLSRVTSGAASPLVTEENGVASSNGGLGISLTAAATLALKNSTVMAAPSRMVSESADLFGTDGEDDGGDEASIFSGTEEEGSVTGKAPSNSSAGEGDGTAERLIKEKKKRRERAGRSNAKSRLKHSLSIINETKTGSSILPVRNALEARDVNIEDTETDVTAESEGDKTIGAAHDSANTNPTWW